MSCNGCRVLRKGCSDDCVIRPCLQWIRSSDGQANATMFLAKFYGRAGLVNLINAGPENLRPAIFRSLLYEACGRIINPIYGSVGLYWSGDWSKCQAAVDSVLKGSAHFIRHATLINSGQAFPAHKTYDIRHIPKSATAGSNSLHNVRGGAALFKRSAAHKPKESNPANQWLYEVSSCDSVWSGHDDRDCSFYIENVDKFLTSHTGHDRVLRFNAPKKTMENNNHVVKLELTLGVGTHASAWSADELDDHQLF